MSLRDELARIYEQRGRLTPAIVVDEARPSDHPLHDRFEWDDSIAGEAWRRQQAHELIRSVRVVYREPTENDAGLDVRAWHAVRDDEGHTYKPADEVAEDPVLSEIVLRDMQREWQQLHRRYGHFAEFIELVRQTLTENAA